MIAFHIGRCAVELRFSFAAVCTFLLLLRGGAETTLPAVLLHEAGHLAAMALLHRAPGRIVFHAFGIDMEEGGLQSYRSDGLISLSGPLSNLCAGLLLLPFWKRFALLNMMMGVFHLLPVFYLDGGRCAYSFLCAKREKEKAEKVLYVLSFVTLFAVGTGAFCVLIYAKGNFSLLLLWVYLMLTLVLKKSRFF